MFREWIVFCRICAKKSRLDNLARHCRAIHGSHPRFLKRGQEPIRPFYVDWQLRMMNPEPTRKKCLDGSHSEETEDDEEEV